MKNSTNFCKRRVSQPFKPYVMKPKNMFSFQCFKLFPIRLLNNITIYKRNKNNSKNGKLVRKIRKFCMKTRSTKSKKTCSKKLVQN